MTTLVLGPVQFGEFELPSTLTFGGKQRIALHRLPGGARIIDAMGRDDAVLRWEGVFTGPDAVSRARTLDLLRAQGAEWPLTWDSFCYSVIITDFAAKFARGNWIPYSIGCTVVADAAAVFATAPMAAVAAIAADLASAASIGGLDTSAAQAAIVANGASVVGSTANALASAALANAVTSTSSALTESDAAVLVATDFPTAAVAAGQLAQRSAALGFVRRAQTNFADSGS